MTSPTTPTPSPGRDAILARIPHREPFLFLDRIVEENDDSITCEWRVPEDAFWISGHYPGQPVLPGVLLSEHAFQAAACLISARLNGLGPEQGVPVLTKIEFARFRRMVSPGETLRTTVSVREVVGPAWYMQAKVEREGSVCARIEFVLTATGALAKAGF